MIQIDRIELADIGNPVKLATAVIDNAPGITLPIPVQEIAAALDIIEIKPLTISGFEGGLITTDDKSSGCILINENSSAQRQRFTIGHELGHYLNPWHKVGQGESFMCSKKDMVASEYKPNDQRPRMEVEANQFAAELLMPAQFFRADMKRLTAPDLEHIVRLATKYDVSKAAMARRYAAFQDEPCALVLSKNGKITYTLKHQYFPQLESWAPGDTLPPQALTRSFTEPAGCVSDWKEHASDIWLKYRGKHASVHEQVLVQEDGYRITMLTLGDEEEESTSWKKPRW